MVDDLVCRYEGVEKAYGSQTVVKDLNLAIRRGEFLTMLGPSGSGKTTVLMMLAGLLNPTKGRIMLDGKPLEGIPPHRRNIGVVFQSYSLFPHMTVADNIAYPLKARRMPKDVIASRVQQSLNMIHLRDVGARRPSELSGGQQQRVALARALVFDPSIVLLDEPLGALDRQLRESMQYELKRIHEETGVTMVYVTHDQGEAMTLSDRVAVFRDGRQLQCAPPTEIYDRPANSFVAEFVGENNRLTGVISSISNDGCEVRTSMGQTIMAEVPSDLGVGEAVSIYLRPERVIIGSQAEACCNKFTARVLDITFLGDHTRLQLEFAGGSHFIAKQNLFGHKVLPRRGEPLPIGWTRGASQILAVET